MNVEQDNVFTVSEVSAHIRNVLENFLPALYIEGEIANFTHHSSGHMYFSLKDENASIRCVFFRGQQTHLDFFPQNGDLVICFGSVTAYEKSGVYQLNVQKMVPNGTGQLQRQYELLKQRLQAQGLFDPRHKKKLPRYPESVGIITSPTGAAFQDIKNVITRRFPCHVFLYPATVQGAGAAGELISGLHYFNEAHPVDVIIIGRGGGSQEDLFCFNDERLAHAIFDSGVPVISAVGHEIDFTIADYVADLRAPTPSAAAELAVPDAGEIISLLTQIGKRIRHSASHAFAEKRNRVHELSRVVQNSHPRYKLMKYMQRLDEIGAVIHRIPRLIEKRQQELAVLRLGLERFISKRYKELMAPKTIHLQQLSLNLHYQARNAVQKSSGQLNVLHARLKGLSPTEALKRGYAIISHERQILRSVQQTHPGETIAVSLSDGHLQCEVITVIPENKS